MVLRKYFYIDESFVNDAFATIFGYEYSEQSIKSETEKTKGASAGIDAKVVTLNGSIGGSSTESTEFNARLTMSAKLQKICDAIKQETGEDIPYYQALDEASWNLLKRDDIFEGVFELSYTKIENYASLALTAQRCDTLLALGKTTNEVALDQIQTLAAQEREHGLPCILTFVNSKQFPCYAYLNEKYMIGEKQQLSTVVTILCKVTRRISKGEKIDLTNIAELMKLKFPETKTGKAAKIQAIKSGAYRDSIIQFVDQIKGPAFEIIPIAIYK
jgi:hypothetical protein